MRREYTDIDQPPGWAVQEAKDELLEDAADEEILGRAREIANAVEDDEDDHHAEIAEL
jgi:hypothetical protein